MIVDTHTFYLGSENMTYNSLQLDRELGIILQDPKLTASLDPIFQQDWNAAQPLPNSTTEACKATVTH